MAYSKEKPKTQVPPAPPWAIGIEENKGKDLRKIKKEKIKPSLVYPSLIEHVARVKQYGNDKYGSQENWTTYDKQEYYDACFRHLLAIREDLFKKDDESGLLHLAHMATNIMFLIEFYERGAK